MTFSYIPLEQIESGPDSVYREVKVTIGKKPGTYYVRFDDYQNVLSGDKIKIPDSAFKEIKKVAGYRSQGRYRSHGRIVASIKNPKTLTDIAQTIEAEERFRRKK